MISFMIAGIQPWKRIGKRGGREGEGVEGVEKERNDMIDDEYHEERNCTTEICKDLVRYY